MPVDTKGLTVGELLERSRAAHLEYRRTAPRRVQVGSGTKPIGGDPVACVAALDAAGTYRKAAEDLDPLFTDPAWLTDEAAHGIPHSALQTFYAEQLGTPDLMVVAKRVKNAADVLAVEEATKVEGVGNG